MKKINNIREREETGNMNNQERMKELVQILNEAGRAYYAEGKEIMSNLQYDALYDELLKLEEESGIILSGSPTQRVGYEVLSELPKEHHPSPMLSLNKTKDPEELRTWLGTQEGLLSWKLDGLTVVLSYSHGELVKAVTRGNGEIGEVVTANAKNFQNVPMKIPFSGDLVLRGEAIIRYSDFERINEQIPDTDSKYKNPRNLCAGSVRQLDPNVTRERSVQLIAFSLVSAEEESGEPLNFNNSREAQFLFLKQQGFTVVDYKKVKGETIISEIQNFSRKITENDFPSDGLVLTFEDIAYGLSLGRTAKFPRNSIAFKWSDEEAETVLREIEWSPSRTGLINPVAIFDPVELEGTTVSRASLHNISYCEDFELGIGDHITVYKANMIIPQIAKNLTNSGTMIPPENCPACGGKTEIRKENDSKSLYCLNPECPAKKIKNFALFVSRDAMNIDGLSEMTLEKFLAHGFIKTYKDIYHLDRYREEIVSMDGFGEKSYENMIQAIESSRTTRLFRVLYSMGIEGIGLANARMLCRYFKDELEKIRTASLETLCEIDGIGEVLAENIRRFFTNEEKCKDLDELLLELYVEKEEIPDSSTEEGSLNGKTVVITGSLIHFSNRKELEELIMAAGGKASGSVSKKTAYLVNNDITSASSKNKKAKELGIPIVTEDEFLEILNKTN